MDEEDHNLFYAVSLPAKATDTVDGESNHIFAKRDEALKFCKVHQGARFKVFNRRDDAVKFAATAAPTEETSAGPDISAEKLPFSSLKIQELTSLRKVIEKGDEEIFHKLVWSNPRYLISNGDSATPLKQGQRYNALHIAAMANKPQMCKVILETIANPDFVALLYPADSAEVRSDRINCLLDSYLNTADPSRNETPLHFAAKFGAVDCVEVLVSYPQCNRDRRNKENQAPSDVVCARVKCDFVVKEKIESLLGERFYVPIYRAPDNTVQPVIAEPWSPDSKESSLIQSPSREDNVDLNVTAFAGPMSHQNADSFYKKLKTPLRRLLRISSSNSPTLFSQSAEEVRLMDPEKGIETQGRELARNSRIPWQEYWSFMDEFCDLSSADGLRKFENYLRRLRSEQNSITPSNDPLSPLSDLCRRLESISLNSDSVKEEYVTPVSSPSSGFVTPPYVDPSVLYINGTEPGKADTEAFLALRDVDVDFNLFPNVSTWKDNMLLQNENELTRIKLHHRRSVVRPTKVISRTINLDRPSSPVSPLLQGMMSPSQRTLRTRFQITSPPAAVRLTDRF